MKSIAMNQEDFFALSSFMIYPQVCNESNMMAATSGAGTAYPYRAPEFTPVLVGSFCQFFSFLCSSLSFRSLDCPSLIQLLITCKNLNTFPQALDSYEKRFKRRRNDS